MIDSLARNDKYINTTINKTNYIAINLEISHSKFNAFNRNELKKKRKTKSTLEIPKTTGLFKPRAVNKINLIQIQIVCLVSSC